MAVQTGAWEFERATLPVAGVEAAYGYFAAGVTPGLHRGLPSRHLTFIVSLDDPVDVAASEADLRHGRLTSFDVIVAGPSITPAYVRQPSRQRGIQLAVHPLQARRLFGATAAELGSFGHEGNDVLGEPITALRERLHDVPDWGGKFALLGSYLRGRSDGAGVHAEVRPELVQAWSILERSRGQAPIHGVAKTVGLSGRQLTKLFRHEFGFGPKAVARLARFDHAIALIGASARDGHTSAFADIAIRCGFYDQSHLVADFRQFTGTTPSQWLREEFRNLQSGGHSGSEY